MHLAAEHRADSSSIPATNPSPGHCPGAGSCFQSVGLQLILQQCRFFKTLPSTVLNERIKPICFKEKGESRFKPVGWLGFWAGIFGDGCQPVLPKGRRLWEPGTGAGAASCHAQLVWWDLHLPGGLGVLSAHVRGAAVSPLLASLH